MQKIKLKCKILLHGYKNQKSFATDVGLSERSLSNKMNGKTMFNSQEIKRIAETLNLSSRDISEIFFT